MDYNHSCDASASIAEWSAPKVRRMGALRSARQKRDRTWIASRDHLETGGLSECCH